MTGRQFARHAVGLWLRWTWDNWCRRTLCPIGLHRWNDNGHGHRPTCALCPR